MGTPSVAGSPSTVKSRTNAPSTKSTPTPSVWISRDEQPKQRSGEAALRAAHHPPARAADPAVLGGAGRNHEHRGAAARRGGENPQCGAELAGCPIAQGDQTHRPSVP